MCIPDCLIPDEHTDHYRAYPSRSMAVANADYHATTLQATKSTTAMIEADALFQATDAPMVHLIRYCTHAQAQVHWYKSRREVGRPFLNGKLSPGWNWNSEG